jgi:hypothetical protein
MPVEIRELHIKVTVNQPPQQNEAGVAPAVSKKAEDDKELIINHCVEEVMEIINNKKER